MEITFLPWWAGAIFIIAIVVLCALMFWKKRKNGEQSAESDGTEGNNSWTSVYCMIGVIVMTGIAIAYLMTSGAPVNFLSLDIAWMPAWANVLLIVAIIALYVLRKIRVGDLRKWADKRGSEDWFNLLHIGEAVVILAMPIVGYLVIPGTPGILTRSFLGYALVACAYWVFILIAALIAACSAELSSDDEAANIIIETAATVVLGFTLLHCKIWIYSAVCAIIWSGLLTVMSLVNYIGYVRLHTKNETKKRDALNGGVYLIVMTIIMVALAVYFFFLAPKSEISGLVIALGMIAVIVFNIIAVAGNCGDKNLFSVAVGNAITITVILLASCGIIYVGIWLAVLIVIGVLTYLSGKSIPKFWD